MSEPQQQPGGRPQGPPDTKRQYRLTRTERADLARAIMFRLEAGPPWHDEQEPWRLRQRLDSFSE